ncbi:MAG: SO_0444 family Cu/Zn efflux transporter [Candidatus Omnitrophica bacterium]|nr:SO_0444 family Cu/Zn efflux transporter [Candidatus Omnitrophota bacterium]
MDIITGVLIESYVLLNEMSPYLLFGFFFAGLLHIFIDTSTIAGHLGGSNTLSVVKASLFGIPLPLCSCGVIPAALSLRRQGASKGSMLSFLISTPTTGLDSIFATYSLLGGFFAGYRLLASFVTGVLSGILANLLIKDSTARPAQAEKKCEVCGGEEHHKHSPAEKAKGVFGYAFGTLLSDTGGWILGGILIGGCIAYFMPDDFIGTYLGDGWKAMGIMLVTGIPMYVCATGSIPIAAALMLKGLSPGAAFVFLLAGPATNAVSITLISREIGKRAVVMYIISIAISGLLMGYLLDILWELPIAGIADGATALKKGFLPYWVKAMSSFLLLAAILFNYFRNRRQGVESCDAGGV